MSILTLDYVLNDDRILWRGKLKYKNITYDSDLFLDIEDVIVHIKRDIQLNNKTELTYLIDRKKFKSYVIYKFIKNKKVVNKKKIIFQIDDRLRFKCEDFNKISKIQSKNDFELFKNIENYINKNLMKNYDSFKKSSYINLLINFEPYVYNGSEDDGCW